MSEVHKSFENTIKELGFKNVKWDNLGWVKTGTYDWFYILRFEGYAYVLYNRYKLYPKWLSFFIFIRNKFVRNKQISVTYDFPIAHFRDLDKFKIFWEILNEDL